MSKDILLNEDIRKNNDLNLHKLLAFASLPASLGINQRKGRSSAAVSLCSASASTKFSPQSAQVIPNQSQVLHSKTIHDNQSSSSAFVNSQYSVSSLSPQMISSKDVYKMTPAPVFMTPTTSLYPQVALIPETDLLRSMIVQDVKQVTQQLLEKNSKKKRGRRGEKEKIIPGDYGTLKINFTKFVDKKHPPFSLEDPPAPKRTVYQRIAPYPVMTTESSKIPEKQSKKAKGSSSRSVKRHENLQSESTSKSISNVSCNDSTTYSLNMTPKIKRSSAGPRRSRLREVRSLEIPSVSQMNHSELYSANFSSELAFIKNFQTDHTSAHSSPQISVINSITSTGTSINTSNLSMETRPESVSLCKQKDISFAEETTRLLDTNSNCIKTSPSFLLANNDSCFTSYSELLGNSATIHDDNVAPNLGSPGVIGNELNSLLSELCSEFPPLSPATVEENMDVAVTLESNKQNTTTVSVLSQPLTSHLHQQGPSMNHISTVEECNALSSISAQPSSSDSRSTNSTLKSTTTTTMSDKGGEACPRIGRNYTTNCSTISRDNSICESPWSKEDQQMLLDDMRNSPSKNESSVANENQLNMEVDANQSDGPKDLFDVVDISPEYASTEGGGKIILIGSWNNKSARYSCKFGNICTPGDLIQNGVLRCFCPPHSPGKVMVSVLCDDVVISKCIEFEYVDTEDVDDDVHGERHDWLKIQDEDLKSLLVERIEAMIDIFDVSNTLPRFQGIVCNSIDIEDALVNVCESISKMQDHLPINIDYKSENVMTILHLSAALGYTKLIQTLCSWVETKSNRIIQQEADPCKYDQFQLTPLMWACAKGKFDSVCVLIQWDEASVNMADCCGCTPLTISRDQEHTILVRYLEKSQSKGSMSKNSSFASDTGSPGQRSGHLSRSSSLSSQIECGREIQCGNDESMTIETVRRGPGSNRPSQDGSPDSSNGYLLLSRTLGQTLVHVQAIIQDGVDDDNARSPLTNLDLDDDSLFTPSPFTPRINSNEDRHGSHTPKSLTSLSPASSAHSPVCQSPFDPSLKDTAEFCEFFYNSDRILEKDFAELTLTDEEQQNLYKAASVIQNAYKRYRERRKQRDVELSAAVLIQSYYRRYKEYAMYKKMQRGAVVIQHKYRAHREMKKQKSQAASVIQSYYRRYKERKNQPDEKGLSESNVPAQSNHYATSHRALPEWKKNKFLSQQRSLDFTGQDNSMTDKS